MNLFNKTFNALMNNVNDDSKKTFEHTIENDNTSAKSEDNASSDKFIDFKMKNEGKMIIKRTFIVDLDIESDNHCYVSDNFMKDDIRMITNIKKTLFSDYQFTMKRLNPLPNRNDNVETISIENFADLEKMFEAFNHPQYKMTEDDDTAILEIVSNKTLYDLGYRQNFNLFNCNPADFVSVYSKELSDIDVAEEKLISVIASKSNMTIDEFRENYGNEIFKRDWKFEDKNKALANIISKYK